MSTRHQNLDRQIAALKAEGCELIYSEKASGKNMRNRPELAKAIEALKHDDVLVLAEWDRVTRSFEDGAKIMAEVGQRKAAVKVLDRSYMDLTDPLGKGLLGLLSAIAEDERKRRQEQAAVGRKRAKEQGQQFGRKPKLTPHQKKQALAMLADGQSCRKIAQLFNVSPSTISRL